jgi:hypothetical protein
VLQKSQNAVRSISRKWTLAIILRSGFRHYSAGADLDIFDKRAEQERVDLAGENRRLNGVEYLHLMELLPIPLIASVLGLRPVRPHLAGEFEFRFPPATSRALAMCSRCQSSYSKNDENVAPRNYGRNCIVHASDDPVTASRQSFAPVHGESYVAETPILFVAFVGRLSANSFANHVCGQSSDVARRAWAQGARDQKGRRCLGETR